MAATQSNIFDPNFFVRASNGHTPTLPSFAQLLKKSFLTRMMFKWIPSFFAHPVPPNICARAPIAFDASAVSDVPRVDQTEILPVVAAVRKQSKPPPTRTVSLRQPIDLQRMNRAIFPWNSSDLTNRMYESCEVSAIQAPLGETALAFIHP
jgi:hypothetical protein